MNITKNGFYKLSEIKEEKITIDDNLYVSIFDDLNNNTLIKIGENTKLDFYGTLENKDDFQINFIQDKKKSDLKVRYLLLSKDKNNLKAKIYSKLSSFESRSDVKIISFVGNDGMIDLDGIIEIDKNIKKVKAKLIEENIFLGESGKIKALPTLLVGSDDVEASHSCKIEKISDKDLFYMRSRGVGKENALNMMIEAKITNLFACLSMYDKKYYNEVLEKILNKIN